MARPDLGVSMQDAADIINGAASVEASRVAVKGVERKQRNPFREIRVVELCVPPHPGYPQGRTLYVHPRQVEAHRKLYGGGRVVREIRKVVRRGARQGQLPVPKGHQAPAEFLQGKRVEAAPRQS